MKIEISTEIVLRGEEQRAVVCVVYCQVGTTSVCIISLTTCLSHMLKRERERIGVTKTLDHSVCKQQWIPHFRSSIAQICTP